MAALIGENLTLLYQYVYFCIYLTVHIIFFFTKTVVNKCIVASSSIADRVTQFHSSMQLCTSMKRVKRLWGKVGGRENIIRLILFGSWGSCLVSWLPLPYIGIANMIDKCVPFIAAQIPRGKLNGN